MHRSTRFVFLPFCSLAQGVRARGIVRVFPAVVRPVIDYLMDQNVNIVQMPCPELSFDGIDRRPCGKERYDTPGNRDVCRRVAGTVAHQVQLIQSGGYKVLAILGIDNSPSCGVDYVAGRGRQRKREPGIYIEELGAVVRERGLDVPFVGIKTYRIERTLADLKEIVEGKRTGLSKSQIDRYKAWLTGRDPQQREVALATVSCERVRDGDLCRVVANMLRTDDQVSIRREAAKMLAAIADQSMEEALLAALEDEDWMVRGYAFIALGNMAPKIDRSAKLERFVKHEVHHFTRYCIERA